MFAQKSMIRFFKKKNKFSTKLAKIQLIFVMTMEHFDYKNDIYNCFGPMISPAITTTALSICYYNIFWTYRKTLRIQKEYRISKIVQI